MFKKYQHLERLGTEEVEGIQTGICYVFPKLDGTNGSVWMDAEGNLCAGSRNRQLLEVGKNDNQGFFQYVLENEDTFRPFFEAHPDKRLYGEWLVPHSLKTYRDDAWRKFYVFDVTDNTGLHTHYNSYSPLLEEYGLDYLAPLAIIRNGTDESFRKMVEKNVFLIEEGKGYGEGVVIKNYGWRNRFGREIWAKVIANSFKEIHHKEMGAPEIGGLAVEEKIVDEFVTEHLVDKVYEKIKNEDGWHSKSIPRLLNTVYYDLIKEETWEILKKHKDPKIDFKFVRRLTIQKVKEIKKDLF